MNRGRSLGIRTIGRRWQLDPIAGPVSLLVRPQRFPRFLTVTIPHISTPPKYPG